MKTVPGTQGRILGVGIAGTNRTLVLYRFDCDQMRRDLTDRTITTPYAKGRMEGAARTR